MPILVIIGEPKQMVLRTTEMAQRMGFKNMFDIRTHNGTITMQSLKTGEHRTFKVWTQKDDAKFLPNARLVGLLSGSDNESDYRAFGVIGDDGHIHLWKKHQGEKFYEWSKSCLSNPEAFAHQVAFNFSGRCRKCNRTLTTPESVLSGIGPVCEGRE